MSNVPVKVTVGKDTFNSYHKRTVITVPRQREPFTVSVFRGTVSRNLTIHPGNSFAYWFNVPATFGIGMIFDKNNPKRYSCPRKIYVRLDEMSDTAAVMPTDCKLTPHNNNIKVSPLRFVGPHPGIDVCYERFLGKRFSVQPGAVYLYNADVSYPTGSGYQVYLDLKLFDIARIKKAITYVGLEASYLNIDIKNSLVIPRASYDEHDDIYYFNFKFGGQYSLSERWVLDGYLGLGPQYFRDVLNNKLSPYDKRTEHFQDFQPHLNLRIGYRF